MIFCFFTFLSAVRSLMKREKICECRDRTVKRSIFGDLLCAWTGLAGSVTGSLYLIGLIFKKRELLQPYIYFLWMLAIIMMFVLCFSLAGNLPLMLLEVCEIAVVILIVVCLLALLHAVYSILIGDKYYYHGSHKKRHVMGEVLTACLALIGVITAIMYLVGLYLRNTHLLQPYIYFLWTLLIVMLILFFILLDGKVHYMFVAVAEIAGLAIFIVVVHYIIIAILRTLNLYVYIGRVPTVNNTKPLHKLTR